MEDKLEDLPVNSAQGMAGYAAELRSCLAGGSLTDIDYAVILPFLAKAAADIARSVSLIAGESIARPYQDIAALAEEIEADRADLKARVAEEAWRMGTGHGRGGAPPLIVPAGGSFRWQVLPDAAATLAEAIGVPGEHDRDHAVAWRTAGESYCAAFAEAIGQGEDFPPGRYLGGQRVTTVQGRQGTLTGDAGVRGHPRVRFRGEREETVPREAIRGPVVHVLSDQDESTDAVYANSALAEGDVLYVLADSSAWLYAEGAARPIDDSLPGRYRQGRYEEGARLAADIIPAAARPERLADMGFPAPVAAPSPPGPGRKAPPPGTKPARLTPLTLPGLCGI